MRRRPAHGSARCRSRLLVALPGLPSLTPPPPGGASQALRVPWGQGDGVAVAYLTRDREVCSAMADANPEPGDQDPVGVAGGCMPPDVLAGIVDKQRASCCGILGGPSRLILDGYVGANAVSVSLPSTGGPVEAELTEPWTDDSPGATPLAISLPSPIRTPTYPTAPPLTSRPARPASLPSRSRSTTGR